MKMEQTESSKTLAYKIQTPWIYPEENIKNSESDESLKSIWSLVRNYHYYRHTPKLYWPTDTRQTIRKNCETKNTAAEMQYSLWDVERVVHNRTTDERRK